LSTLAPDQEQTHRFAAGPDGIHHTLRASAADIKAG
jgi:hypothetical protein